MIIDFRVRPPYGSYVKTGMYQNLTRTKWFAGCMGMTVPKAAETQQMEDLLAEMVEAGVDKIAIPGRKAKNGTIDNQDIVQLVEQFPEKIIGIPGINPLAEDACAEIDRLVVQGNCSGVIMEPGMQPDDPMYADDTRLYPVYEHCERQQVLLVLAVGSNAGPDQTYAMPQHVEQVAIDFPKLNIVVTHGCWPWTAQACQIAFRRENVYLSPDLYMIHTPGCQEYITAANYMCKEKLLYGTSYPFANMKDAVAYYQNCGIREDALDYILYKNAAKLLHLTVQ